MGKRTWNSISEENKPLKNRLNIVLTSDSAWGEQNLQSLGVLYTDSLDKAMDILHSNNYKDTIESAVVIGGVALFQGWYVITYVYLTSCVNHHIVFIIILYITQKLYFIHCVPNFM